VYLLKNSAFIKSKRLRLGINEAGNKYKRDIWLLENSGHLEEDCLFCHYTKQEKELPKPRLNLKYWKAKIMARQPELP
jgi:hypothetical protein